MQVGKKNLRTAYWRVADEISRLDIDQEIREEIAEKVTAAFVGPPEGPAAPAFPDAETFKLVASDPLCPCAGTDDGPCPHGREIRIGMHLSSAEDGRSKAWSPRKPIVRCVSCGAKQFIQPSAA